MIIVTLTRAITGACAFETREAITDVTVIMVFWGATVTVKKKILSWCINNVWFRMGGISKYGGSLSFRNPTGFLVLQSGLTKTDTSGSSTMSPSKRDVRLMESQLKGVNKGRYQLEVSALGGVCLMELSFKREWIVFYHLTISSGITCACRDIRELKQQRFWATDDSRYNCIIGLSGLVETIG